MKDNDCEEILKDLKENLKPFKDIAKFSAEKGIYAVGFNGEEFPLHSARDHTKKNDIIYIGKSEKSQISRDLKTHFESVRSGSSTLRRSLGAILREELNLIPIPRSCTEKTANRFTNYKFNDKGEEKLTQWMKTNLSLSYYEWKGSIPDLRKIEKEIIKSSGAILNLQNNPDNKWKSEIKKLRKDCRDLAEENINLCK